MSSTKNPIKDLAPQMRAYEKVGQIWRPFVMYFHSPNIKSKILNTDDSGFRYTVFKEQKYSVDELESYTNEVSIVVGGSTVFGVGASSDANTMPSLLSEKTNQLHLNFGGRAFGSNQEFILFCQKAHKLTNIKNVILFSGLNDLYLSQFQENEDFGPFFFSEQFSLAMQNSILSNKRRILKAFLFPVFKNRIDYSRIQKEDLKNIFTNFKLWNSDYKKRNKSFDVDYAINQIKKNLYLWKSLSKTTPFNIYYILQPSPSWFEKDLSKEEITLFDFLDKKNLGKNPISNLDKNLYEKYQKRIKSICLELEIPFLDTNKTLYKSNLNSRWLFVDRAHLTDLGYAKIVDLLSDLL